MGVSPLCACVLYKNSDVRKQPLGHLKKISCQTERPHRGSFLSVGLLVLCSMTLRGPSPMVFLFERGPSLTSTSELLPQNFAETLPTEMSVKIFEELDTESLCNASQTCRLWHQIIEESEQLWRRQCQLVRAVCQREVDSDRRDGLSWKVTLVRNYTRSCVKRDWLRGRYSHVRSVEELSSRKMTVLDAETWGEILQAELDR